MRLHNMQTQKAQCW